MPEVVYFLCALASSLCATLLLRKYRQTGIRLLFWSSVCFICFALNNLLLFVDMVVFPDRIDLRIIRNATTLVGLLFLLYGMIWDTE